MHKTGNRTFLTRLFGVAYLIFLVSAALAQQPEPLYDARKEFTKGKDFIIAFKNDSAIVVFDELYSHLAEIGDLETPFGIRVQARLAEALEKDQQDELALDQLLAVKALSQKKKVWDAYTNTCLTLANLYEKRGMRDDCINHLRLAQSTISQNQLDTIYPRFAIRIASYNRVFNISRDSAIYYANEALRTVDRNHQKRWLPVANLLLGLLNLEEKPLIAIKHFQDAATTFDQLEDYTGHAAMLQNIARIYQNKQQTRQALFYSDSTIRVAKLSNLYGHQRNPILGRAYLFRADIFKSISAPDSALYYSELGYQEEIKLITEQNQADVLAINEKYKDEQRVQKIKDQENALAQEKQQKNSLLAFIGLILVSVALLAYFLLRLRQALRHSKSQAQTIEEKNTRLSESLKIQQILQAEMHHRVKNNLQVIISLLEIQKEDITDPQARENLESMAGRIYSMAAIHEILHHKHDQALINFREYVENLCLHFCKFSLEEKKPIFDIDIPKISFNLATLMPLGIILNELLTNSLKYARQENDRLRIKLKLEEVDEGYKLDYLDNGPGLPSGYLVERPGGLGTYLLHSMSRQLKGQLESRNQAGAFFQISFTEKIEHHDLEAEVLN